MEVDKNVRLESTHDVGYVSVEFEILIHLQPKEKTKENETSLQVANEC